MMKTLVIAFILYTARGPKKMLKEKEQAKTNKQKKPYSTKTVFVKHGSRFESPR